MPLDVETAPRSGLSTLPENGPESSDTEKPTGPSAPAKGKSSHLASLDGLRGIACLMVLYGHTWRHMGAPLWNSWHSFGHVMSPWHLFAYAYGGVDIFFILSGFCLAYPIIAKSTQPVDWKRYFINRVRRIVPPYWAALLMFGVISVAIIHFHIEPFLSAKTIEWPGWKQVAYALTLVSTAFNSSFWTLPLEWRWYFVLPVFIVLWRYIKGPGLLALSIPISMFWIYVFQPAHLVKADFLIGVLPTYLPLFALGVWAAELIAGKEPKGWQGRLVKYSSYALALSMVALVVWGPLWPYRYTSVSTVTSLLTWGPLGFFAVLAAAQSGSLVNRITSHPALVSVGVFSYSLYLIHEPFVRGACTVLSSRHPSMAVEIAAQFIIPTVLIGAGYLFFLVAEKPFLRKR